MFINNTDIAIEIETIFNEYIFNSNPNYSFVEVFAKDLYLSTLIQKHHSFESLYINFEDYIQYNLYYILGHNFNEFILTLKGLIHDNSHYIHLSNESKNKHLSILENEFKSMFNNSKIKDKSNLIYLIALYTYIHDIDSINLNNKKIEYQCDDLTNLPSGLIKYIIINDLLKYINIIRFDYENIIDNIGLERRLFYINLIDRIIDDKLILFISRLQSFCIIIEYDNLNIFKDKLHLTDENIIYKNILNNTYSVMMRL